MRKKYSGALLAFILSLGAAMLPIDAFAEGEEQGAQSEETLTATVSLDDAALEAEAGQLGVPDPQTKRYVVDVKSLNQRYQQGSLTRTEYVRAKRGLIEDLK